MKCDLEILSLDRQQLGDLLKELGQPSFRAEQVFSWLHNRRSESFDDMTNVPLELRDKLKQMCAITSLGTVRKQVSADGTKKYLFSLIDGNNIETVSMRYSHGVSVCVSTQVGCAMGCAFCASAVGGKARDLSAAEILAQVYEVSRDEGARVDSVVLMGIGEPLDNFDSVAKFCDIIIDEKGYNLPARAITLSTCGIVPGIYELADHKRQLTLSVSLHAADNDKRSKIMPINKRYPLGELIAACRYYFEVTGRRVTFEYAVIAGENDSIADADGVAKLLSGMNAHVNLIPVNRARGPEFYATRGHAHDFKSKLTDRGINATVRRTLGSDINAACGQLRRKEKTF